MRALRHRLGLRPVYKTVDTCAAEFARGHAVPLLAATTRRPRSRPSDRPKVLILGSGPNRIGQGIEFDYSCVHAVQALRAAGYETVMVNCNPETVSTDYDTADRLYFEPLTFEDVLEVWHAEDASGRAAGGPGVVGRDRAARRADPARAGPAAQGGRGADRRHLARVDPPGRGPGRVRRGCWPRPGCARPAHGTATSFDEAKAIADEIGYPVLVRPSYVLGGRGMEIVYDDATLRGYIARATDISPEHPVLVDRFLDDAIEIDVDALVDADGEVYLGGIMEHIEEAGIHSGDSACALPPITLASADVAKVRAYTEAIARGVGVRGPAQRPVRAQGRRALRAGGQPAGVADRAVRLQGDRGAAGQGGGPDHARRHHRRAAGRGHAAGRPATAARCRRTRPIAVKEAVLPFKRFRTAERQGRGQPARPGDEVDRRGDGHRHRVRARVRQVAGGRVRVAADRRARSSSPWPTGTSGA